MFSRTDAALERPDALTACWGCGALVPARRHQAIARVLAARAREEAGA